jgi:hypothetical protein
MVTLVRQLISSELLTLLVHLRECVDMGVHVCCHCSFFPTHFQLFVFLALLDPGVFCTTGEKPSLAVMLQDYLDIARVHTNKLVDVQRHVAWMIKRHTPKSAKAELFQTNNLVEIAQVRHNRLLQSDLFASNGICS